MQYTGTVKADTAWVEIEMNRGHDSLDFAWGVISPMSG